jgi:hypothetical protein
MSSNICNYEPIINLSIRDINRRLKFIHQYLCFLSGQGGGGGEGSDGLSTAPSGDIVLGQDVGEAGNPAALTVDREVPLGTNAIYLGDVSDEVYTKVQPGRIEIWNNDSVSSPLLLLHDTASASDFSISNQGGVSFIQLSGSATLQLQAATINLNGPVGIQHSTPTAMLHIGSTDGSPGTAPLKFEASGFLSPSETGAMEFDGVDLTFTRLTERGIILIASAETTETVTPDTTITVNYNGSDYKLVAQAV